MNIEQVLVDVRVSPGRIMVINIYLRKFRF